MDVPCSSRREVNKPARSIQNFESRATSSSRRRRSKGNTTLFDPLFHSNTRTNTLSTLGSPRDYRRGQGDFGQVDIDVLGHHLLDTGRALQQGQVQAGRMVR